MVDENGAAVILKNNSPRYVILDYSKIEEEDTAGNQAVEEISAKIIKKHIKAFQELAK
jgi:antitoxin Phd